MCAQLTYVYNKVLMSRRLDSCLDESVPIPNTFLPIELNRFQATCSFPNLKFYLKSKI